MAIAPEVKELLDKHAVDYEVIEHPAAYTSQEEAAAAHVSGYEWAKTVIVFNEDSEPIMIAIPASYQVDMVKLQELLGAEELRLGEEDEFADLYPNCEPGAMPPLGVLYNQPVVVEQRLTEDERIVFDAGTHTDAVRMRYEDFERLVGPIAVGRFGRPQS